MACFLVPTAEAIVVTAAAKIVEKNEMKADSQKLAKKAAAETEQQKHLPWSKKLMILAQLLWGGAFLLCFEHIWHGEVTPWFPFLTAAATGDTMEMLHEMATTGVGMAALVTLVWVALCKLAERSVKNVAEEGK